MRVSSGPSAFPDLLRSPEFGHMSLKPFWTERIS